MTKRTKIRTIKQLKDAGFRKSIISDYIMYKVNEDRAMLYRRSPNGDYLEIYNGTKCFVIGFLDDEENDEIFKLPFNVR